MRIFGKGLATAAVLAFVGGLSVAAQAAPVTGKVAVSPQLELAAAKKKAAAAKPAKKAAKKSAKKAAKKAAPGRCGVMNYYDKKTRKCVSAMMKKG